jgi:hypothetical protein
MEVQRYSDYVFYITRRINSQCEELTFLSEVGGGRGEVGFVVPISNRPFFQCHRSVAVLSDTFFSGFSSADFQADIC